MIETPLKIVIPRNEYNLLKIISEEQGLSLKKLIEDNCSFILNNENLVIEVIKKGKINDPTVINPQISIEERNALEKIAKGNDTTVEILIASSVPSIISHNKELLKKLNIEIEDILKEE